MFKPRRAVSYTQRLLIGTGTVLALTVSSASVAQADETDDLIASMEKLSREAAAKNEEVKQLEDDLDKETERVDSLQEAADAAEKLAEEAQEQQQRAKEEFDKLAGSRYRLSNLNREVSTLGADDPQHAIDRATYLGTLSRQADGVVRNLAAATQKALSAQDDAEEEAAAAKYERAKLEDSLEGLREEKDELEAKVREVKERIDSLNEEQRQRWEEKNKPQQINIEIITEQLQQVVEETVEEVTPEAPAELSSIVTESVEEPAEEISSAPAEEAPKQGPVAPSTSSSNSTGSSSQGSSVPTGSGSALGAVQAALSKIGAPYSWGATGPDAFDCSGLIYWAYQQQGMTVPRTSQAQLAGGTPVSRDQLQPGDVVGYYPGVTHVGMYIGDGKIVHASDYGIPVQVVDVDSMPWAGAARF
ncbi:NlpC/P60 family protein [Corynebacterium lowii]|uniref:Putative endopeptidase n=1 Tax=Corynebacterium lowii TaxID=1544413 RepID=A0A0Q0YJ35_9CORY|nr:NlpC/P60 family protein [Corynebacterium lowii]KQB86782.1 putative endopeptidase precursor [Corynebacterium lowii]MDP9851468.1 cell wall-associated NlpC family hydrolase/cell division protein FtsB [Corynebacterium lowii]